MVNNKTQNITNAKEQRRTTPSISVKIDRMVDSKTSMVKAYASANIGNAFAIHGIRVIDSQKGLFVQMPQNSYQKNGKTEYNEIFHPITADARRELNEAVLSAYEQRLHMREDESQDMDDSGEDEAPALELSM